jgi:hypothetical protein
MEDAISALTDLPALATTTVIPTTVWSALFSGAFRNTVPLFADALGAEVSVRTVSTGTPAAIKAAFDFLTLRNTVTLLAATRITVETLATISAGESAAVTTTYLSTAVRFAGTVQVFIANTEQTSGDR